MAEHGLRSIVQVQLQFLLCATWHSGGWKSNFDATDMTA